MCFIQEQNGVPAEGMWSEIRLMVECMSLEEFFCVECQVGVCLLRHANTPHATHQRTLVSIPSGHKLWMPDYRQPHLDLESSPTPLGSSVFGLGVGIVWSVSGFSRLVIVLTHLIIYLFLPRLPTGHQCLVAINRLCVVY